jgi:hypothetical protein
MSVPLTATAKLQFVYSVKGLQHKLASYCAYNDVLGQHQLVDRDGITTILWTTAAQTLWDALRQFYQAADVTVPASVSLYQRSGFFWNLIDVFALTGAGNGASAANVAQQSTWVLRDSAHKFVRFVVLETLNPYVGHSANGQGIGTVSNALSDELSGANVGASMGYRWIKSRGDRFLAATGVIAGLTYDVNDKLKRARGLA